MELINRQDAIDAICEEWCGVKNCDCKYPFDLTVDDSPFCDGCDDVEIIKSLPTVIDYDPPTTNYIPKSGMNDQCSLCKIRKWCDKDEPEEDWSCPSYIHWQSDEGD